MSTAGYSGNSAYDRQLLDPQPMLIPHGVPGLKRSGGFIDEELNTNLRGTHARRMFREMADNDPVIGASLWIIESLCRQVEWETKAAETDHPLAQWGQEFTDQVFGDMESSWRAKVGELLTFDIFGHAIIEPEYKIRRGESHDPMLNSKYGDGLIGWREWGFRPQESVDRWVFDDTGRLLGLIQRDPNSGHTPGIPIDRVLLFRVRSRKNNPEGYSLLRPAYPSYYYAKRLREVEAIGIERNIAGMPDYQLPLECFASGATAEQQAALSAAKDFVKKIRVDAWYGAVRPTEETPDGRKTGYKFQLLSSSGKSFADTSPIITRHETRAAQVFMTEFMMTGTGSSSSGSYSLHSDKTSLLAMACAAQLDIIDDETNDRALPMLWRANHLPRECMPTRKHGDIEKQALLETFNAVSGAVSQGAMEGDESVENLLRRLVSLEPKAGQSVSALVQQAAMDNANLGEVQTDAAQAVEPEPAAPAATPADPGADGPDVWLLEEAAENLRVSPTSLRNAIKRGQLPAVPIGRTYRIQRKAVERMFSGGYSEPTA